MTDRIGRVRRRLRFREAMGGLATAMILVGAAWMLLPGVAERLREALLTALLLLVGAGLIVFYRLDHRHRRWIEARAQRRAPMQEVSGPESIDRTGRYAFPLRRENLPTRGPAAGGRRTLPRPARSARGWKRHDLAGGFPGEG